MEQSPSPVPSGAWQSVSVSLWEAGAVKALRPLVVVAKPGTPRARSGPSRTPAPILDRDAPPRGKARHSIRWRGLQRVALLPSFRCDQDNREPQQVDGEASIPRSRVRM